MEFNLIPDMVSNYIHYIVWEEINALPYSAPLLW